MGDFLQFGLFSSISCFINENPPPRHPCVDLISNTHTHTHTQGFARFALSINYDLLHGWVKQPSPCCAAASLAGAINALRGLSRYDDGAWGHRDVLEVMSAMLDAQAGELRTSAERCLGADLAPLLAPLQDALEAAQLSLDNKECTKAVLLSLVRDVAMRMQAARASTRELLAQKLAAPPQSVSPPPPPAREQPLAQAADCFHLLCELFRTEEQTNQENDQSGNDSGKRNEKDKASADEAKGRSCASLYRE